METLDVQELLKKVHTQRQRYRQKLNRKVNAAIKELESVRPTGSIRKLPVVEEPPRVPEKCHWDFLLAEVMWLQVDMTSERKWKQNQWKKLGKEFMKHKHIVDRQSGVDIVELNLQKVSTSIGAEVEKFWKGVNQLATYRFNKYERQVKQAENQKRLDELVDRTELVVRASPGTTPDDDDHVAKRPRLDDTDKNKLLNALSEEMEKAQPRGNSFSTTSVSVPIPSLLRGTMREYQHIGLDWLVALHDRGLNGILADEMGLGKTLQTISLLAHLACDKGIWGPHLIVVPTSVLVNWEIELKKFCPGLKVMVYYGSAKERKAKRVGWTAENAFHVCICSYALVLQDASVFRKKNWYYLILDEAHHIKNFKSMRWQNLLTFKTARRLLLTGTPLQNDLLELWSLLHFLMPSIFTSHSEFQEWFSEPLSKAIEHSKLGMHKELINRLHALIRPFLLRRLKRDVEKQMPSKYEHVIPVPLSRRQQVLYDEFLSHRETRQILGGQKTKSADYLGLMNVLMQLRKVCNHPNLLEPREVVSPFVMKRGDEVGMEISKKFLMLPQRRYRPIVQSEMSDSIYAFDRAQELGKNRHVFDEKESFLKQFLQLEKNPKTSTLTSSQTTNPYLRNDYVRASFCEDIDDSVPDWSKIENFGTRHYRPTIGSEGLLLLRDMAASLHRRDRLASSLPSGLILDPFDRLDELWDPILSKFICVTKPVIVSPSATSLVTRTSRGSRDIADLVHCPGTMQLCRFPDKSFLEWDCGKFRFLKSLLKKLSVENHKVVLFTQMSKMLDVIEAFANWCGFTYVRLDGSTKVGDRQLLVDRFNCSKKIFLFISSTRAGGVGINLTSADTVIFFDSDWNPAMDKQAMDRCHRIGQVRDVHVYRLISEKTIEENIFVKQLQKRKLDEVVIDRARNNREEELANLESYPPVRRENKLVDDLLSGIFSETGLSDRSRIYGTHVLWEREEMDNVGDSTTSSKDLALLAQVEDAEDTMALSNSVKETEILIHEDEGKEDEEFEKLPGIVKRSVLIVESQLINEAEQARLAATHGDESDDWDAIENAEWESESE